jgi:DNA-binding GntR family transcriptional regulator
MKPMETVAQSNLIVRVTDWIKADALNRNEIASLARLDLIRMAEDLGVSEAELRAVLPRTSENPELLARSMTVHGLDPAEVMQSDPTTMRRLVTSCARCQATARCRYALAHDTAVQEHPDYCANAEAFEALAGH